MFLKNDLTFKIASDRSEFDQIHRLNYNTFVEEIPQHTENDSSNLVDKFHSENTYIISLKGAELVGMIAVRDKRPFSLDCKIKNLDNYLPDSNLICEIRLLSIKKSYRNKKVISGLFSLLAKHCEDNEYDLAIISATTRELGLYKKLGFKKFGSLVGDKKALYQPMYLTFDSYNSFKRKTNILKINDCEKINFLPGPAQIGRKVEKAFISPPVSHRSKQFLNDFNTTKKMLCTLTNSKDVEILMGSGSVANDVVAAQISLLKTKGLIISNGHFGDRLIDHANRFLLNFDEITHNWGEPFDYVIIEEALQKTEYNWIWFVHCETSTGVLNNLERIKAITKELSVKLCVDCISSIGTYPFSLENVYLASGVSGKALCSYPGLSFVFYNYELNNCNSLPRYIDLSFYKNSNGVPFTISSNLLYALKKSLELIDAKEIYKTNNVLMATIREKLLSKDINILSLPENASDSYLTFKFPSNLKSDQIGEKLEKYGFYLNYRSGYLLDNNLMQIALLGQKKEDDIQNLLLVFDEIL